MADEVQNNLDSYYLQLQQVDAALTSSPNNEELLKLKKDLEEVIDLTKELLTGGKGSDEVSRYTQMESSQVDQSTSLPVPVNSTFTLDTNKKQALLKHKEYLKKRKQKKLARVEEQEKEREKVKKKWLNFSTKKGLMNKKKSIFASPDTVDGRVGIGTCGVSGKPMTESAPLPVRNSRPGKFRNYEHK